MAPSDADEEMIEEVAQDKPAKADDTFSSTRRSKRARIDEKSKGKGRAAAAGKSAQRGGSRGVGGAGRVESDDGADGNKDDDDGMESSEDVAETSEKATVARKNAAEERRSGSYSGVDEKIVEADEDEMADDAPAKDVVIGGGGSTGGAVEAPKSPRLPARTSAAATTPMTAGVWQTRTRRLRSPTAFFSPAVKPRSSRDSSSSAAAIAGRDSTLTPAASPRRRSSSPFVPSRRAVGTVAAAAAAGAAAAAAATNVGADESVHESTPTETGEDSGNSSSSGSSSTAGSLTPDRDEPPDTATPQATERATEATEEGADERGIMTAKERREYRRSEAAARARELRARGRRLASVTRPLGVDRDGRLYMTFRGDFSALYVGAAPAPLGGSAAKAGDAKAGVAKVGAVKAEIPTAAGAVKAPQAKASDAGDVVSEAGVGGSKDGEGEASLGGMSASPAVSGSGAREESKWEVFRGKQIEEMVSEKCTTQFCVSW